MVVFMVWPLKRSVVQASARSAVLQCSGGPIGAVRDASALAAAVTTARQLARRGLVMCGQTREAVARCASELVTADVPARQLFAGGLVVDVQRLCTANGRLSPLAALFRATGIAIRCDIPISGRMRNLRARHKTVARSHLSCPQKWGAASLGSPCASARQNVAHTYDDSRRYEGQ